MDGARLCRSQLALVFGWRYSRPLPQLVRGWSIQQIPCQKSGHGSFDRVPERGLRPPDRPDSRTSSGVGACLGFGRSALQLRFSTRSRRRFRRARQVVLCNRRVDRKRMGGHVGAEDTTSTVDVGVRTRLGSSVPGSVAIVGASGTSSPVPAIRLPAFQPDRQRGGHPPPRRARPQRPDQPDLPGVSPRRPGSAGLIL